MSEMWIDEQNYLTDVSGRDSVTYRTPSLLRWHSIASHDEDRFKSEMGIQDNNARVVDFTDTRSWRLNDTTPFGIDATYQEKFERGLYRKLNDKTPFVQPIAVPGHSICIYRLTPNGPIYYFDSLGGMNTRLKNSIEHVLQASGLPASRLMQVLTPRTAVQSGNSNCADYTLIAMLLYLERRNPTSDTTNPITAEDINDFINKHGGIDKIRRINGLLEAIDAAPNANYKDEALNNSRASTIKQYLRDLGNDSKKIILDYAKKQSNAHNYVAQYIIACESGVNPNKFNISDEFKRARQLEEEAFQRRIQEGGHSGIQRVAVARVRRGENGTSRATQTHSGSGISTARELHSDAQPKEAQAPTTKGITRGSAKIVSRDQLVRDTQAKDSQASTTKGITRESAKIVSRDQLVRDKQAKDSQAPTTKGITRESAKIVSRDQLVRDKQAKDSQAPTTKGITRGSAKIVSRDQLVRDTQPKDSQAPTTKGITRVTVSSAQARQSFVNSSARPRPGGGAQGAIDYTPDDHEDGKPIIKPR